MVGLSLNEYHTDCLNAFRGCWYIFLGNTLEWYEFSVYGYLASEITSNFFATRYGSIATWLGFGVTFLARPVGSLIFGWVGDRFGRRVALLISLMGMIIATVGQGMLPSDYCCSEDAGQAGMIILLILRVLQGLCTSGEIGNVSTYIAEQPNKNVLGMLCAFIGFGSFVGFVASSTFVLVLHLVLTKEQMLLWGWRIPFLVVIFPGLIALFGRRNMHETEPFLELMKSDTSISSTESENKVVTESAMKSLSRENKNSKKPESNSVSKMDKNFVNIELNSPLSQIDAEKQDKQTTTTTTETNNNVSALKGKECRENYPVLILLRDYPFQMLYVFFGMGGFAAMVYIGLIYSTGYLRTHKHVDGTLVLAMSVVGKLVMLFVAPIPGYLSDKIGVGKTMAIANGMLLLSTVAWVGIIYSDSIIVFWLMEIMLGFCGGFLIGPYLWVAEAFPVSLRASGFFSYNMSLTIFGGFGPMVCAIVAANGHQTDWQIILLYGGVTLIAFVAVILCNITHRSGHVCMAHIRTERY